MTNSRRIADNALIARLDANPLLNMTIKIIGILIGVIVAFGVYYIKDRDRRQDAWNMQQTEANKQLAEVQRRTIETVGMIDKSLAVTVQRLDEQGRRQDDLSHKYDVLDRRFWPRSGIGDGR